MLDLIRDIILATDLAHHLRIFKDLQKMADGMSLQHASQMYPLQINILHACLNGIQVIVPIVSQHNHLELVFSLHLQDKRKFVLINHKRKLVNHFFFSSSWKSSSVLICYVVCVLCVMF